MSDFRYIVSIRVKRDAVDAYKDWLINGHIDAVLTFDGILSAELIDAGHTSDGDQRFTVIYLMRDESVLQEYQSSALFKSFQRDWDRFNGQFEISRSQGSVIKRFTSLN